MKKNKEPDGSFRIGEAQALAAEQTIYLMRHAKPELPGGGRIYYGRTDYPLCAEGAEAAEELARFFRGRLKFSRVYSSGMTRADQTARIIAPGSAITAEPALREIDLGEWEGRSYDEVRGQFSEIYERRGADFASVAPPGGETFKEVQRRTMPAFEKIAAEAGPGNILVVAHGAVIWTIMSGLFGLDLNDMFFYALDYCGINILEPSCGRMKLVKYNWAPLPGKVL